MGSKLDTVEFKGNAFLAAMRERGWAGTRLSVAVGRNKQYVKQATANCRINYETLLAMCKVLGVDPDDYIGRETYDPIDVPTGPIKLDHEGTVVLLQAIISRAKEDYILAYRDQLAGKKKVRDGHVALGVDTIEWELGSEWFREHLIGAVTTNTKAVDTMVRNWRREAKRTYNMTVIEAREWINPATSSDKFREACVKKGEKQAEKEFTQALLVACQCMSKVIAWEGDGK